MIRHLTRPFVALLVGVLLLGRPVGAAEPAAAPAYVTHPDDPAKRVEYFLAVPQGRGPWPVLVLLHGHQDAPSIGGLAAIQSGEAAHYASLGYLTVALSVPGFGGSSGPDTYAGPFGQHGVQAVVRHLQSQGLATKKVALLGASLGAMTAGLLLTHDRSISGAVLISGEWDLVDAAARGNPLEKQLAAMMAKQVGGDPSQVWRSRSLVFVADRVKAPVLVLAGADDDRTMPDHARRLVERVNAAGGHAKLVVYPGLGHRIPPPTRREEVDRFLASVLGK